MHWKIRLITCKKNNSEKTGRDRDRNYFSLIGNKIYINCVKYFIIFNSSERMKRSNNTVMIFSVTEIFSKRTRFLNAILGPFHTLKTVGDEKK